MAKKLDFDHTTKLVPLLILSTTTTHWFGQQGISYLDTVKEVQFSHLQDTSLFEDLSFDIEPWEEGK